MRVAAYARYSSDLQRDASLEDQLRNCRDYCTRMGWRAPVPYTDAAMSGSRNDRPAYQRLLADADGFDVVVVDDLTRLSRDSVEVAQAIRNLRFRDVRVVGVSDGLDTGRKGYKAEVGLRGLMGELYLDDLREKTHRGLKGRAQDGASAGGLPYGYRVTTTGEREIVEAEAAVVRRVYADYLSGASVREIVKALNAEGIPSPRGGTWAVSAVHGDIKRGIGILANPIYRGQQVWNRSTWVKHPESGKRLRRENPPSEWVTMDKPELAIVQPQVWEAVQDAIKRRSHAMRGTRGRPPKHLLSGLLRCGQCGGPLVVMDRYNYGCATAKDRGTCDGITVKRGKAEAAMLAGVREALLSDQAMQGFQQAVARHLKAQQGNAEEQRRALVQARKERDNMLAAIRQGIITPSTRAELERLESVVASMERPQPSRMMPDVRGRLRRLADSLADTSKRSPAVREALRTLIGEAVVRKENGVTGAVVTPQLGLVAGAGFEPATFGL